MNKAELIDVLAEKLEIDRRTANDAVEHLIDAIVRAVDNGDSVTLTGFGVFERRNRAARVARNPRTGETVRVKPTSVPAFRPGAQFKAIISGAQKLPAEGPAVKRGAADGAVRKSVVVVKKAAKKAPARKAAKKAVRKTAAKKAVKKAVRKTAAKKAVKKAVRKTAAKKAVKKAVRRTAAKKAVKKAVRKTAARKAVKKAVRKTAAKKAVKKAVRKSAAKKAVRKTAAKKAVRKTAARKAVRKSAAKKAVRRAPAKRGRR